MGGELRGFKNWLSTRRFMSVIVCGINRESGLEVSRLRRVELLLWKK